MVKVRKDLTGVVVGQLTIISQIEDYVKPSGEREARWLVQCSCGSPAFGVVQYSLTSARTNSCGCLNIKRIKEVNTKHGKRDSKEYDAWCDMKKRCLNLGNHRYLNYGGRGIVVCDRWLNSFETFYEDMGECPEGMSLDRIDVNGNYTPENCRWADCHMQAYNKTRYTNNSTGRTGVSKRKNSSKFVVQIGVLGSNILVGTFNTLDEAIAAREAAELKYYGYIKE